MIVIESRLSAKALRHTAPLDVLSGLVKISGVAMTIYFIAKVAELAVAGEIGNAFAGTTASNMFLLELGIGCIVPLLLFYSGATKKAGGLLGYAIFAVTGVVLNRFGVVFGMGGYLNQAGGSYAPAWTEYVVSAGLVSIACLLFLFLSENFNIVPRHEEQQLPEGHLDL